MVKHWQKLGSKPLSDYRIFKSRQDTRRSPRTNKVHEFYILESPDWMNVIPITSDGNVVFVHQFRHGLEEVTMEIPGGLVDPGEDPLHTASRELMEETGYEAEEILPIGIVTPNPAFLDNICHTFLAFNVKKVAEPQFDGSEDIVVSEVPLTEVPRLIQSQKITHALVVAAFYHYERYLEARKDVS
ncbi:MAG: NUDIX hydrolase [Chloroflexota bacterium]